MVETKAVLDEINKKLTLVLKNKDNSEYDLVYWITAYAELIVNIRQIQENPYLFDDQVLYKELIKQVNLMESLFQKIIMLKMKPSFH